EDEDDRRRRERDRLERRSELGNPPAPVREKGGDEEDEEHLPELRRLEAEEGDVDPTLRASRRLGDQEHEQHQPEHEQVDRSLGAAVPLPGDEDRTRHQRDPDERQEQPADGKVGLDAGDAVLRDPGDRPEAVADESHRGREQDPVEAPEERPGLLPREALGSPAPRSLAGWGVLDHQSEYTDPPKDAFALKNCSKTFSA